jgi:hypothetical protein
MKKIFFGMMMLALLSFSGNDVLAQKTLKKARDLFIEKEKDGDKGKPGVKVRILLKRGNQDERYVSPNETFYSGDKIKLAFDINFSGYITLLNVGSSGKISMLYPYVGTDAAIEPSEDQQLIPANKKDWISFDNRPGTEKISVVFSTNPIESVNETIALSKQSDGADSDGEAYNASGPKSQSILTDLNSSTLKRSKSRDLFIETVKDDATYVVAESSFLAEPAAFVITLKHQ